jgi:hypothetical protein
MPTLGLREHRLKARCLMNDRRHLQLLVLSLAVAAMVTRAVAAPVPDAIAAPGETVVATFHAEGAQVYDCKPDASGKLAWQLREPIATLLRDGVTMGRHYAGPIGRRATAAPSPAR